jgi:hypothetical protein
MTFKQIMLWCSFYVSLEAWMRAFVGRNSWKPLLIKCSLCCSLCCSPIVAFENMLRNSLKTLKKNLKKKKKKTHWNIKRTPLSRNRPFRPSSPKPRIKPSSYQRLDQSDYNHWSIKLNSTPKLPRVFNMV